MTSMAKSRQIAAVLKELIQKGEFILNEPVMKFPQDNKLNSITIREKSKRK